LCALLDTVTGCAVHSTLDPGASYTSIDLSVSYLRAVDGRLRRAARDGIATKVGRRVGFAEGRVVDAQGREVATATSSLLIIAP